MIFNEMGNIGDDPDDDFYGTDGADTLEREDPEDKSREGSEGDEVDIMKAGGDTKIVMTEEEALKEDLKENLARTIRDYMCPQQAFGITGSEPTASEDETEAVALAENALHRFRDYFTLVETLDMKGAAERHLSYFTWRVENVPRSTFINQLFDLEKTVPILCTDLGDIIPEIIEDLAAGEDIFAKEGFPESLRAQLIEESKDVLGFFKKARGKPAELCFPTLWDAAVLAEDPSRMMDYLNAIEASDRKIDLKIKISPKPEGKAEEEAQIYISGEPHYILVELIPAPVGFLTSLASIQKLYESAKAKKFLPTMDNPFDSEYEEAEERKTTEENPKVYLKETIQAAEKFRKFLLDGASGKGVADFYIKVLERMTNANQEPFPSEGVRPYQKPEGGKPSE